MPLQVSIYSDGQPVVVSTLAEFLMANVLEYEQLKLLVRLLEKGQPAVFGGGAEPLMAVKIHKAGDDALTLNDVLEG